MSRAMIVVAAGSGSRFAGDKMMAEVNGVPLVAITVNRISPLVDWCVLVARPDQFGMLKVWCPEVTLVEGGATRTESEIAGLSALHETPSLIGIHDGARPNINPAIVEELFTAADRVGGAVPVLRADTMYVEGVTLRPLTDVGAAQTPQVFRGYELVQAYRTAMTDGFVGHDTADVVERYSNLEVAAVEGDPENIKVTYPEDLARVIPL